MEIDAVERKPAKRFQKASTSGKGRKQQRNPKGKDSKKESLCYNYQKSGHYTNACPTKKIEGNSSKKEPNGHRLRQEAAITKHRVAIVNVSTEQQRINNLLSSEEGPDKQWITQRRDKYLHAEEFDPMGTVTLKEWMRHNIKISDDKRRQVEYDCLSWTAYYDDNYLTHISDKEGTRWFLREPR